VAFAGSGLAGVAVFAGSVFAVAFFSAAMAFSWSALS